MPIPKSLPSPDEVEAKRAEVERWHLLPENERGDDPRGPIPDGWGWNCRYVYEKLKWVRYPPSDKQGG